MKFAALASPIAAWLVPCLVACGNTAGVASGTTGNAAATTSSGSGSGTSGSGTTSGSSTSSTGGTPITAPAEQWTWVPFDDAFCGNGSPTGIGVNLNPNSTEVLLYLEGGGACYSELTCFTFMTAENFSSGYGSSDFMAEADDLSDLAQPGGFFDRTAAANPFQNYSYVFVPYCTGDLHAGNNVLQFASGTANFVGYANLTSYLQRLVPTFPAATHIVLAGSSAGGFGALYNWSRIQQVFGAIPVTLIDDSGTFLPGDVMDAGSIDTSASIAAWNLSATEPPGCTGCAFGFDALYAFGSQASPGQRGALLSYSQDTVLPSFYGLTEAQFTAGLDTELTENFDPNPNLGYFVDTGQGHVLWFSPQLTVNNVTLQTWLSQMVTGSSGWPRQEQ